jgi:thiol-disulfide isomerase/thioredoxin
MRLRNFILALLCSCSSVLAQKPLAIGDTVPDILLMQVLNHSSATAKLSDFKGKLIILDFWATWCTSCLHSFAKMDSLQAVFGAQLKILLVNSRNTGDDLSKLKTFFTRWQTRTGKSLSLTTAINDTIADRLFPHQLIPHYVWIDKDRRLIAISSSDAVTAANIQAVLNGENLSFIMKKDQDARKPIFSNDDLPLSGLLNYAVLVKGWFDGLPSGDRIREKDGIVCGRAMTNTSLLDMYGSIVKGIEPSFTGRQLITITNDSADLLAPPPGSDRREAWYKEHAYTLDLIVPAGEAHHLFQRMLELLNQYSGYKGAFEKKKMKCWVLLKNGAGDKFKTKGGKAENSLWNKDQPLLRNGNIALLVNYLNSTPAIKQYVINETGYTGNIDLEIEGGLSDMNSIQQNLGSKGLMLQQAERVIKLFVIRKS